VEFHVFHMVHLDFTWIPPGFHVELDNNLAGLPAKKFHLESMFPCEFHVDSMWNHLESMGEGKVLATSNNSITYLTKVVCTPRDVSRLEAQVKFFPLFFFLIL
jgi:hypothetical protein